MRGVVTRTLQFLFVGIVFLFPIFCLLLEVTSLRVSVRPLRVTLGLRVADFWEAFNRCRCLDRVGIFLGSCFSEERADECEI